MSDDTTQTDEHLHDQAPAPTKTEVAAPPPEPEPAEPAELAEPEAPKDSGPRQQTNISADGVVRDEAGNVVRQLRGDELARANELAARRKA